MGNICCILWSSASAVQEGSLSLLMPALDLGWFLIRRWSWPAHTHVACAPVKLAEAGQSKAQQQPSHAHNFSLAGPTNLISYLAPTGTKTMIRGLNHRCLTAFLSPPLKCNYQAGLIYIFLKKHPCLPAYTVSGDVNNFRQVRDGKITRNSIKCLKGKVFPFQMERKYQLFQTNINLIRPCNRLKHCNTINVLFGHHKVHHKVSTAVWHI